MTTLYKMRESPIQMTTVTTLTAIRVYTIQMYPTIRFTYFCSFWKNVKWIGIKDVFSIIDFCVPLGYWKVIGNKAPKGEGKVSLFNACLSQIRWEGCYPSRPETWDVQRRVMEYILPKNLHHRSNFLGGSSPTSQNVVTSQNAGMLD